MSNLCPMCKKRPVTTRTRCDKCQAEIDERWATIDRHDLNEIWRLGGCEAVERYKLEKRTCDACGTMNNEANWRHCSGCGASSFELAIEAFTKWYDKWKGKNAS